MNGQSNLKTKHYSHHLRTKFNLHIHNQFLFSSYSFNWPASSIMRPKPLGLFPKTEPGAFPENPYCLTNYFSLFYNKSQFNHLLNSQRRVNQIILVEFNQK